MRTHASWKVTRNVDIFSCRENVRVQNPPVGAASLAVRGARRGSWGQGLGVCCVSWHSGLASRGPASDGAWDGSCRLAGNLEQRVQCRRRIPRGCGVTAGLGPQANFAAAPQAASLLAETSKGVPRCLILLKLLLDKILPATGLNVGSQMHLLGECLLHRYATAQHVTVNV